MQAFCRCLSVRTGCLVIGTAFIVYSAVTIVVNSFIVSRATGDAEGHGRVLYGIVVSRLVFSCLSLPANVGLLVGVAVDSTRLLLLWMTVSAASAIAAVIEIVVASVSVTPLSALCLVAMVVPVYAWAVVATHHANLTRGQADR